MCTPSPVLSLPTRPVVEYEKLLLLYHLISNQHRSDNEDLLEKVNLAGDRYYCMCPNSSHLILISCPRSDYIHASGHKPLLIEKAQRDSAPQFLSVESLVSLFVLLLLLLLLFLPAANAAPAATATATAAAATAAVSRCCFFFFVFPSILPLPPR